jgi:hypothetical protein
VEGAVARAAQVTGAGRTLPAFNRPAAESVVLVALVAPAESAESVVLAASGILLAEAGTSRMVRVQPVARLAVAAIPSGGLLE